jgi:phosphoglycerol transferase
MALHRSTQGRKATNPRLIRWLPYVAVFAACLTLAVIVLKLWSADFRVPFAYSGDAVLTQAMMKGLGETGSDRFNPALGAPGGLDLGDYPGSDGLHIVILRLLMFATPDSIAAVNLYYLLTYPLAALTAFWAFRRMGTSFWPAASISILYAFLPFHLARNESHLFLSAYYLVPIAAILALRVSEGRGLPITRLGNGRWSLSDRRSVLVGVAGCALLGMGGIYYALFACFLLLVGGVTGTWWRRRAIPLANAVAGVVVVALVIGLASVPNVLYVMRNGPSPEPRTRTAIEAEIYAVRISQLLLPVSGHRLTAFRDLGNRRHQILAAAAPLEDNENDDASLGIVGAVGFLVLLATLLFRRGRPRSSTGLGLLVPLAILNGAGTLLGITGGFGFLFALLVSPQIRAYNRVSVFLAFFCLAAVVVLIDAGASRVNGLLGQNLTRVRTAEAAIAVFCGLVLLVGLFDQVSPDRIPDYASTAKEFARDGEFAARVEAAVPKGSMVFQLPYVPFPESPPVNQMTDYTHFKAYLHTRGIRWSYGAMRGREGDQWLRSVSGMDPESMVTALRAAGFAGIWVDTRGYADGAIGMTAQLQRTVGSRALVSPDGVLVFIRL